MPPVSVELKKQVKAANDIADVVAAYLPIHPNGKAFKAVCPFHDDTRPSLQIDRGYQNFKCWACGAHGDVFDFVMKFEKVPFPEALRTLAQRAGIALEPTVLTPEDLARGRMLHAMKWAEEKYRACLLDDAGAEAARRYLGERKLSGATVRQFGLGFAPVAGDWLVRAAHAEQLPIDVLVEVGLFGERDENRGQYDRFRDRVMFPIRDVRGQTVGFGGRILPDSPLAARAPKYYNSSDTPLFSKSDLLFGLDLARHAGAAAGYLAVVEGYTDVMMAHQCGVANVVATMGTALNARHVAQLRRYAPKVVLVFDADAGGMTGVDRALELFVGHDVELGVATLPDGLDPCDLLSRPGGVDEFRSVLANAVDALECKLHLLLSKGTENSVDGKNRIVDAVLGVMAIAPPIQNQKGQVRQELMVTRLAQRLGLRQETVWARLTELRNERRRREAKTATTVRRDEPAPAPKPSGPAPALERQLVELLLAEPELVSTAAASIPSESLTHSGLRRVVDELYSLHGAGLAADLDALRVRLVDRPDLARAALEFQYVGRQMTDRPEWLQRIAKKFAEDRARADSRVLKERLANTDETEAVELLKKLQARSAAPAAR